MSNMLPVWILLPEVRDNNETVLQEEAKVRAFINLDDVLDYMELPDNNDLIMVSYFNGQVRNVCMTLKDFNDAYIKYKNSQNNFIRLGKLN